MMENRTGKCLLTSSLIAIAIIGVQASFGDVAVRLTAIMAAVLFGSFVANMFIVFEQSRIQQEQHKAHIAALEKIAEAIRNRP